MEPQEEKQDQHKPSGPADGQAEQREAQPPAEAQATTSGGDNLQQKLADAETRAAEMEEAFMRAKAESENIRRRAQEDVARAHKFAIEDFADSLVPVKESLERALEVETPSVDSLKEGVDMTLKQLSSAFQKNRLFEIDPRPGEKLDPEKHQAISMVPTDQDANTIVSVLQKGYMIADRLLRPALVTVSQAKPS
jgi:molecular chaperone GrpE